MQLSNLTPQTLRKAADLQERIQSLQSELASLLGGDMGPVATPASTKPTRHLTAAGRAAIAAAAKARWARAKANNKTTLSSKPKRKMSSAARARLAAVARERWKKAKASGKSKL